MSKQNFENVPALIGGFIVYILVRHFAASYVGSGNATLFGLGVALLVAYLITRWNRAKADE